ncbi:MAG: hypothetical protein FWE98_08450 [Oscillospiraceae bacterium]|nr:hypothetical protein [Oscillospiraceae bacterium]
MRHIFVINPASGKGSWMEGLLADIEKACAEAGIAPEIFKEPDREAMMAFMRQAAASGEPVRIYACGGDGTIFCAVNATYGHKNVQIAAVPYGSGNDFVKLFGEKEQLRDIRRHINGTPHWIDAIECGEDVSVNIVSMGFDAEVNARQAKTKKIPLVGGPMGYNIALLSCVAGKFYSRFTVQIDDEAPVTGDFSFAIGGNSRWYGGGFKSCPKAIPDDGLLDCVTVRKAFGRLKMITMIGTFKKGQHLDDPTWLTFTNFNRGKMMRVHCDTPAAVNIDGEIRMATDVTFALKEQAVCYVVPEGSDYFARKQAGTL